MKGLPAVLVARPSFLREFGRNHHSTWSPFWIEERRSMDDLISVLSLVSSVSVQVSVGRFLLSET
jgi:hypothetical protein